MAIRVSEDKDRVLLDMEKANIRNVAGVKVQTIPQRWIKRRDLQNFFKGKLEIALIQENGQPILMIRIVPTTGGDSH